MSFEMAISGDSIVMRRISRCTDSEFRDVVELFKEADAAYTHLETPIHDFDGREIYPAAEGGGTWMRSPTFVAEELKWAGFDLVSHPSNHALDYSYGGLYSTWEALDDVGIPYAGTGYNLADARSPAYLDTPNGRVGLVSMTSSFTRWSRAGEARRDVQGRPGVNPLRYQQVVSSETAADIKRLAKQFGWWIIPVSEDRFELTPPGIHNTTYTFVVDDERAASTVVAEADRTGNLKAVQEANDKADIVLVHAHIHEWNGRDGEAVPPDFLPPFAKQCLDAGADLFLSQGSHNFRGIELYDGKPIFYDLGDLFLQVAQTRLPAEYYANYEYLLDVPAADALPFEGTEARAESTYNAASHPPQGYWSDPVPGFIVPVLEYTDRQLETITIHPGTHFEGPKIKDGLPRTATDEEAATIIDHIADLSSTYGTSIKYEDGRGKIHIPQ
jgi:poly-gamma-glutamate synthesis protein (capsule biosynthesis protein)